ncbi:MFS transporter [Streptomyces iconiensis]|uniref:MFS transporter n=1 Tax=Streptomyces iconiensis TaxID=1384038 RepID=A0ABT6ZXT5_9ACTN|nr:MFS transporter [Streptomyces iconiensis]MDJ1133662.1 MFS transporter [Streptomyces iconiensis]
MSADPGEKPLLRAARVRTSLVVLLTGGMGLSMFVLYAIGALGPFLIEDLGISRSQLGLLTSVTFASATLLSLLAGHTTDLLGGRRAFVLLLLLVAAAFALLTATTTYALLLGALVLGGAAQSLANPATNKLIAANVPTERRAMVVGIKQSGVPLAALTAGLVLPALAGATSWRTALAVVAPVALLGALAALLLPRDPARAAESRLTLPGAPDTLTRWLMAVSLCVGCGLAALNTYLPLYAHQRLSMGEQTAGALISAIGVSGIASRLLWSRFGDRLDIGRSLLALAVASVVFGAVIPAATAAPWLIWVGAVGLGGSGAAANAVSMVAVIKGSGFGRTGHASALVSMGFFAGFVVGPTAFGLLVDTTGGFGAGWLLVTLAFAGAAACSWGGRHALRSGG